MRPALRRSGRPAADVHEVIARHVRNAPNRPQLPEAVRGGRSRDDTDLRQDLLDHEPGGLQVTYHLVKVAIACQRHDHGASRFCHRWLTAGARHSDLVHGLP
jgi:hypothetical protein